MQSQLCSHTVDQLIRSYDELVTIPTFEERFEYLKLNGFVGDITFGGNRYQNQRFYSSAEWKKFRRQIIIRDHSCDLGIDDGYHDINSRVIIHHINPITIEDIRRHDYGILMDPNNVICVSHNTHEAIHYSSSDILERTYYERTPNDTILWEKIGGRNDYRK